MNFPELLNLPHLDLAETALSVDVIKPQVRQVLNHDVRYLVLSDIHLGHKRTPTKTIVANLVSFFKSYRHKDDLDIIFFAGDVFDASLELKSDDIGEVLWFLGWLFDYCAEHDVILRVLEGTPSHDWAQSKVFGHVAALTKAKVDYKYVNALSIEKIEGPDITVLYMPDEWNLTTDKTYDEVLELLREKHLDKVDIGIFHGMFAYQAPPMATKLPVHDEARYLSIVRYFINIGHVHSASVFDRILAQGSFDRLSHGDESPKGAFEVVLSKDGDHTFCFIENPKAVIYKTLLLKSADMTGSVKEVEKLCGLYPKGSHVRLKAAKSHPAIVAFDELRKKFIDFNLSKLTLEEEEDQARRQKSDNLVDESKPYQAITITPDNIGGLLAAEIKESCKFTENQWAFFHQSILQAST